MKILSGERRRQARIRGKLKTNDGRLRITVFRSNRYFYAQVIDSEKGNVLVSSSSFEVKKTNKEKIKKSDEAKLVGIELAKKLKKKGLGKGVLDRKSYAYLGRVKAFTDGLREGGIEI